MRVLITGGAGYVGTALVEKLAADEVIEKMVVYDNLSRGNRNFFIGKDHLPESRIEFVQGDLLDSRLLKAVLKDIDVVYHLAANVTTPFSDQNPHLFEQVNHWGTAELVYAIEESDVKRLVYLSSVSVYGASERLCTVEDTPDPKTFYGISKLRGEQHVQRLKDRGTVFVVRCGNVYGYNKSMRFDAVVNKFMFDANFNRRITVNGSGEQFRPFVHVEKVADSLTALLSDNLKSSTYNLVDRNLTIGEVVESLRKIYPELEMLFVNQHMKMRELKVEGSEELKLYWQENKSFTDELLEFKQFFTF